MKSIWEKLLRPFFVLAPMDDVTDTVFRQVVASLAPPDLYFTEFVNVDALNSQGREAALTKLKFTEKERPIIAQVWGKTPNNFYKATQELVEMGFDGIDINFGCPEKNVIKNGCCIAMINTRPLAMEIIQAVKAGAGDKIPVSVKTRLGLNEVDFTWHEELLEQKLNALTVHGRTAKQMSRVEADWDAIGQIARLRDKISPDTAIIGNGDVMNRRQGLDLAKKHGLDGVMIGRGIFQDPFVFAESSPWAEYTKQQKIDLYTQHVKLFAKTWKSGERNIRTLNKFCKVYINGFDGASALRDQLMHAPTTDDLLKLLTAAK